MTIYWVEDDHIGEEALFQLAPPVESEVLGLREVDGGDPAVAFDNQIHRGVAWILSPHLGRKTGGQSRFMTPRERVDLALLDQFAAISPPVAVVKRESDRTCEIPKTQVVPVVGEDDIALATAPPKGLARALNAVDDVSAETRHPMSRLAEGVDLVEEC